MNELVNSFKGWWARRGPLRPFPVECRTFHLDIPPDISPYPNHKINPNSNPNTNPTNPNQNPTGPTLPLTLQTPLLTPTPTEQSRGKMSQGELSMGNYPFPPPLRLDSRS